MIDVYMDELHLTDIKTNSDSTGRRHVLRFRNKEKDESVSIPMTDDDLINIFLASKHRCETLDLITYNGKVKNLIEKRRIY